MCGIYRQLAQTGIKEKALNIFAFYFMAMIDGTALNVIIEETHKKKVYLSMKALFERSKK